MNYKRVLIKLSGEMLGEKGSGFSPQLALRAAEEIKKAVDLGAEVAVLVGGGNIMRAKDCEGLKRLTADRIGMIATVINALGLKEAIEKTGVSAKVMSAVNIPAIAEPIDPEKAQSLLSDKTVVVFAGGTGAPYFTTDTAAALRALEIEADLLVKATKVDGVYSSDPAVDKDAKLLKGRITYDEVMEKKLLIMDQAAFSLLNENGLPVVIFNFREDSNLLNILKGDQIGTFIGG